MNIQFRPKLLDTLRGYDRGQFSGDLSAGITVGVLALPLAMAFAIASGMSPTAGIWTAIVAGFLIAALGGSRVQIGGPTGAFIPIIYAIVVDYGVQNLLIATMMSGVMLLAMGAFRLGSMIRFIPLSVVIGFTNGIAVVIFVSQIKDFLGLRIDNLPGEFFGKMRALVDALPTLHLPTVALALASLAVLMGWNALAKRAAWMRRMPGPLAVLVQIYSVFRSAPPSMHANACRPSAIRIVSTTPRPSITLITRCPRGSATQIPPSASRQIPSGNTSSNCANTVRPESPPSAAMSKLVSRLPTVSPMISRFPSGVITAPFGNISPSAAACTLPSRSTRTSTAGRSASPLCRSNPKFPT